MADMVVVGAGIVGAAIAYESARAGAEVVLVDRALPAFGATGASFAWIGGPRARDGLDGSTPLRRRVVTEYQRLEAEVPGVQVHWRGSVTWTEEDDEYYGPLGRDESLLDSVDVAQLEPHLKVLPTQAVLVASDGAVDPVAVTQALVRAAQRHGAQLAVNTVATSLRFCHGRVTGVETSGDFVPSRTVVLTAGVDAPVLCASLGFCLPVAPSPALLMRFTAPPGLVRTLIATPDIEVREAAHGELLVAADYQRESSQEELRRAGEVVLRRLVDTFHDPHGVRLVDVRLGVRPMPADGLPVIGPVPGAKGAYVAVMHSGVTLAPVVGRLVAGEVVDGLEAEELGGVRPDRFRVETAD